MRDEDNSSKSVGQVDALSAWLLAFSTEQLLSAEALPDTTTPLHLLRVVRARPVFEPIPRLVVVNPMLLPGSKPWAEVQSPVSGVRESISALSAERRGEWTAALRLLDEQPAPCSRASSAHLRRFPKTCRCGVCWLRRPTWLQRVLSSLRRRLALSQPQWW